MPDRSHAVSAMTIDDRIVIGGGPLVGKTVLAGQLGTPVRHTDDLHNGSRTWPQAICPSCEKRRLNEGDSECNPCHTSRVVAEEWMTQPGPWVIEGIRAVHALRTFMLARDDAPCDMVIWLREEQEQRTRGQQNMALGIERIFSEIVDQLRDRGVAVLEPMTSII